VGSFTNSSSLVLRSSLIHWSCVTSGCDYVQQGFTAHRKGVVKKPTQTTTSSLKLVRLAESENPNILRVCTADCFFFFLNFYVTGVQRELNIDFTFCMRAVNEDWIPSSMLFRTNYILY